MNGILYIFFTTFIEISLETYNLNPVRNHNRAEVLGNSTLSVPEDSKEPYRHEAAEREIREFKNLKRKWEILTSSRDFNRTVKFIPQSWLLPTDKQNMIFNASQARPEVAVKLAAFMKKHQIHNRSKMHDKLLRSTISGSNKQQKSINISLKDKLTDVAQKLPNIGKERSSGSGKNILNGYSSKNETARKMFYEEWKLYYQCLQSYTGFEPKAHYAFPGETIKMTCKTCLRPGDETIIEWRVSTSRTGHREKVFDPNKRKTVFNSNNRILIKDKGLSLHIYGVNEKDAGNYSCKVSKAVLSLHLLQVAEANENMTKVWPEKSHGKQKAALAITLPNFGLTVFTKWKNWTACSRCSHVGKRYKVGVCMVRAANGANNNAVKVLSLFREGIPCRSKLLPHAILNHPNVASRNSEIMERFCKEPCPKAGKYIVRDEKGEIVEEADNAKGVYSMLQRLPDLRPVIQRKIMFLKQWDTAHIQCPGSSLHDIPTRWFVNKQPIFAKGDRIYVTPSHTLVVEDLGLSDSDLYSCWQGSRLVGTVRLIITEPVKRLAFSEQISAISMILIVITLILIFVRAFGHAFLKLK